MKKPWYTNIMQLVPFSSLGLIVERFTGCSVAGAVKHSVTTMYINTSCTWVKHTAVTIGGSDDR